MKVGDTMTLRSFGRSGSLQTALVKVYGVFELNGLEKSPLAGSNALVDMITFRELYGFLTTEKRAEQEAIKKETGAKEVNRESAEAELFGDDEEVVAEATPGVIDPDAALAGTGRKLREEDLIRRVYTQQQLDDGVVRTRR